MKQLVSTPVECLVYAHAPIAELQACLETTLRSFSGRDFTIVREADCDPEVSFYLRGFAALHGALLMENFDRLGYWKSVTKAIDRSRADYLVILDSSAVFSPNGLAELVELLHADGTLEVALPLINPPIVNGSLELLATTIEQSGTVMNPVRDIGQFGGCPVFAVRRSSVPKLASWRHADAPSESLSEPLDIAVAVGCCALDQSRPGTSSSLDRLPFIPRSLTYLFRKSALFLLADDAQSALLEIQGLRDCGMRAHAVMSSAGSRCIEQNFPGASVFCNACDEEQEILALAASFDFVVATNIQTAKLLKKLRRDASGIIPMYYLRDYEPWSLAEESAQQEAERTLIDCGEDFHFFSRSDWLCRTMWQRHRIKVSPIAFGLDRNLFNGFFSKHRERSGPLVIACAIRPASPAGNAHNALRIIRKVAVKHGKKIDVRVFGCTDEELDQMDEARAFRFRNLALLNRPALAEFLWGVDIFVDLSVRQSEGSSGLEAMAVGCAVILPREGCAPEITRDGENCILVDTSDEREILRSFDRLIADPILVARLQENGIRTGRSHSLRKTVWSMLMLLAECVGQKARHAAR